MLLGEPFAIVGALLVDPPSPRMRLVLERLLLALVLIQIPLAAFELATFGPADSVQGTLYGAGAGAHVISAVTLVGGIWILSGGIGRDVLGTWALPVVAVLFLIPFVADAKQVILASPAILLAARWRGGNLQLVMRGGVVAGAVLALFTIAPESHTASQFLQRAENGQGGKQATAVLIWHAIDDDAVSLAVGKGPAETVSRAAFMTTSLFQQEGSPFSALGLQPAPIALEAADAARRISRGGTSFNAGTSSTLGVLGDLGIAGMFVYAGLVLSLFLRVRAQTSPEGLAAGAGLALFLVLGLVFDWWEQPPYGVFLGTLAGLSLAKTQWKGSGGGYGPGRAKAVDE